MDEFWTFSRVFRLRKLQNCNLTKNPTKFANFGSILTGLKFKMRKNSSNWKEIENFSWLKLSEEFTRKSTSNSSSCCLTSSYLTNFFRVLNIFTNFARVFRLKSFKASKLDNLTKIRQNWPTFKPESQLLLVFLSISRFFREKRGKTVHTLPVTLFEFQNSKSKVDQKFVLFTFTSQYRGRSDAYSSSFDSTHFSCQNSNFVSHLFSRFFVP